MLERVAIATPLRSVCALLLALLFVRVDAMSTALVVPASTEAVAERPCTYRTMRTRGPGLHRRYLMRDLAIRE